MPATYYQILECSRNASQEELRQAYRRLAKKYHPDKSTSSAHEERFKLINEAYHVLSDPQKKVFYDLQISSRPNYPHPASRPRYKRRTARYYREPQTYSKRTWAMGFIFVIAVISMVTVATFALINYASSEYFEQAQELYDEGEYRYAVIMLRKSTDDYGSKTYEACALAAKILIYNLNYFAEAENFIKKGLKSADSNEELAILHFYRGIIGKKGQAYDSAYVNFQKAAELDPRYDSAFYYMGELDAFVFRRYDRGIENYKKMLSLDDHHREAYLGMAYCEQQLDLDMKAITNFSNYLQYNPSEGTVYYLKAVSELKVQDTLNACVDLTFAANLGIEEARKISSVICQKD